MRLYPAEPLGGGGVRDAGSTGRHQDPRRRYPRDYRLEAPHILSDEERKKVLELRICMWMSGDLLGRGERARSQGGRPHHTDLSFTVLGTGKTYLGRHLTTGSLRPVHRGRQESGQRGASQRCLWRRDSSRKKSAAGSPDELVGRRAGCGLTMEVGVAGDVPDVKREDAQARLGKGRHPDPGRVMLPNLRLRDLFVETAERPRSPFSSTF